MRDKLVARLVLFIVVLWVCAALVLRWTEGLTNPEFGTIQQSLWNIAVYLFSGLDSGQPQTGSGKVIVTLVLVLSAGVVAIFTGEIASFLIERRLWKGNKMPHEMAGHVVICNWNDKVLPTIFQLHAPVVLKNGPLPVVVVCDRDESAELTEQKDDDPRLEDVYIINGDPARKTTLRRAKAHQARSVIVMAEPGDGDLADARSILIVTALKSICSDRLPHICVEGVAPQNIEHFCALGVRDVVAATDLGMRLLAQATLSPGLTGVYMDLLTNSEDTNELYAVDVPDEFEGTYAQLNKAVTESRDGINPVILIGIQKPDGSTIVNPKSNPNVSGKRGDKALVIAFDRPISLY